MNLTEKHYGGWGAIIEVDADDHNPSVIVRTETDDGLVSIWLSASEARDLATSLLLGARIADFADKKAAA